VVVWRSIAAHRGPKHENPLLFSAFHWGLCAPACRASPIELSRRSGTATGRGIADAWTATRGVKSAEQIDKEWQDSTAKFDGRRNTLLKLADEQAHEGPYRPDWETLRSHEIPRWFRDAKFGIFVGWGVYAVPGAVNEWYPHNMYRPGDPAHNDFVQRFGSLDSRGYKEFIPSFRAEKFDPHDWVKLFKLAGAKYVVPIAEHHDGFAMYDSDLSDWTAVKMGPQRDVLAELSAAIRGAGLHLDLLGSSQKINWLQTTDALSVKLPADADCKYGFALRVKFASSQEIQAQEIRK
jgi:alpha-L-fucosidase